MRQPFIRITRHPYEEPYHLNLVVASNGRQRGELEIYAPPDDLVAMAAQLRDFPGQATDRWDRGGTEDRWRCRFVI